MQSDIVSGEVTKLSLQKNINWNILRKISLQNYQILACDEFVPNGKKRT